jgi:hypothetical protein
MSSAFRRFTQRSIGTTATRVGSYTVGANTATTVIGITAANKTTSPVNFTLFMNETGNANTNIVVDAPIPSGSTLIVAGGSQKIVLTTGDGIFAQSSANNSVDVILSVLEVAQ